MVSGGSGRWSATLPKNWRVGSSDERGARQLDARGKRSACRPEHNGQTKELETADKEFPMIPKAFASAACLGFCALITFASSLTPDSTVSQPGEVPRWRRHNRPRSQATN